MLKQGLYEQVVNTEIKDELRQLPEDSKHVEKIDSAESSSVLTQYLSEVVHKGLEMCIRDRPFLVMLPHGCYQPLR